MVVGIYFFIYVIGVYGDFIIWVIEWDLVFIIIIKIVFVWLFVLKIMVLIKCRLSVFIDLEVVI